MNYYDALSSEVLLTNLLAFPQCGYKARFFEYYGDFGEEPAVESVCRWDKSSGKAVLIESHGRWWRLAPPALVQIFGSADQLSQACYVGWSVHDVYTLCEKKGDPIEKLALLAQVPQLYEQGKALVGCNNIAYLARGILSGLHSRGLGGLRQNFLKAVDYEQQSAQELGIAYVLDLERYDCLRCLWVETHQAQSPFIRLLQGDNKLFAPIKLSSLCGLYTLKNVTEASQAAWRQEACETYHQLYDPDAIASPLQLAVQIRLFLCHLYGYHHRPDWLTAIGTLFQRTLPIVFECWPTLMGLVGESLARPMPGVRQDFEQALGIYQSHQDYYRMAMLYASNEQRVYRPCQHQLAYLLKAALKIDQPWYTFPKKGEWASGLWSGAILPEKYQTIQHLPAFIDLCNLFHRVEPKRHCGAWPDTYPPIIADCLWKWQGALSERADELQSEFRKKMNELCLKEAYRLSDYFVRPRSRCNAADPAPTEGSGISPYSTFQGFLLELESKRRCDPLFRRWTEHRPETQKLILMKSGVLKTIDAKLPFCAGQIVQLHCTAAGDKAYLQCYGYPIYPIHWYQVLLSDSSDDRTTLLLMQYYHADSATWSALPEKTEVVIQWLPIPTS